MSGHTHTHTKGGGGVDAWLKGKQTEVTTSIMGLFLGIKKQTVVFHSILYLYINPVCSKLTF